MSFSEALVQAGFSSKEADVLSKDERFAQRNKNKSAEEILRRINAIANVYVVTDTDIRSAVLKFPPFAGLDHERVIRHMSRLGRIVGVSEEDVKNSVIKNPVYAGYSAKRYIAALDIGRELRKEGFDDKKMLHSYLQNISKSPYVPGTERLRISQVVRGGNSNYTPPPLMNAMRRQLERER